MQGFPEGWTDHLKRRPAVKALGNSVLPQVAQLIGYGLARLEAELLANAES